MSRECAQCGSGCEADAARCAICGAATGAPMREYAGRWRAIHVARTEWEACLVSAYLDANGVPAEIRGAGVSGSGFGSVFLACARREVLVPERDWHRGVSLLRSTPAGLRLGRMDREYAEFREALARETRTGSTICRGRAGLILLLLALAAVAGALAALLILPLLTRENDAHAAPGASGANV